VPRVLALLVSVTLCLVATVGTAFAASPKTNADVGVDLGDASGRTGASISYAVAVSNAGPATATGVVLTVVLPAGLELVSGGAACSPSGQTVVCQLGSIPAGQGAVELWELRAAAAGTYAISGSVTADQTDPSATNNSDTAQIVVSASDADVSIDLATVFQEPSAGADFFWSYQVRNSGPGTATNIVATIDVPAGLEVVTGAEGCTHVNRTFTCPVGTLASGQGVGTIWRLRASDAGTYTITGSVTADQPDNITANNSDSTTFSVSPAADVAVRVVDSMDPVKPGQGVTYTTTVTNNGPSAATGVTLSDVWSIDSGKDVVFGSATTTQGTCAFSGMRLDCQLGTLAAGDSATVTFALKSRGGGSLTVTAATSASEPDPQSANNSATETTTIGPK
jgi:uncharacterized repeat protein (TIGR01451 family)